MGNSLVAPLGAYMSESVGDVDNFKYDADDAIVHHIVAYCLGVGASFFNMAHEIDKGGATQPLALHALGVCLHHFRLDLTVAFVKVSEEVKRAHVVVANLCD